MQPAPAVIEKKEFKKQQQKAPVAAADEADEWNDVREKKAFKPASQSAPKQVEKGSSYGGITAKGFLVAGPIQ